MKHEDKNKKEESDITQDMQDEIDEIEYEEGDIDEEKIDEVNNPEPKWIDKELDEEYKQEDEKCRDVLARTTADFDNFKKRTERDKKDMIFFLKSDLFKKILPRIDDLERIIKNTPEKEQNWVLLEWLISLYKKFKKDLDWFWVKSFDSIWETVDPDKHDVMTTLIWKEEWIIVDEFEKGYLLWDRILRHAKVIVWAWDE